MHGRRMMAERTTSRTSLWALTTSRKVVGEDNAAGAVSLQGLENTLSSTHRRTIDLESLTSSVSSYGLRMVLSNTYEFLFTSLLYVVGFGNIIRFPELLYDNGGGVFLLPYILCLTLFGVPLFYLELAIGQYASLGPIRLWRVSPIFKGVGYGVVLTCMLTAISYNVTVAWATYYFFASMQKVLPWSLCPMDVLKQNCKNLTTFHINNTDYEGQIDETTPLNEVSPLNIDVNLTNNATVGAMTSSTPIYASEVFFFEEFLHVPNSLSEFGYPHWRLSLCLMFVWIIVFIILTQEIKSAGRVALVLTPLLYSLLIAFIIQSFVVSSSGAKEGLLYFLSPRWEYLAKPKAWVDAASHVFYSLSLMQGGLITLSSYNKFTHNIYRAAILIPLLDALTSILAGLALFSVLGVTAHSQGIPLSQFFRNSTGASFVTFSEATALMPLPQLWAALFFFVLICLGLGSQYVLVETGVSALLDNYHKRLAKKRLQVIAWICLIFFLLGLPLACPGGIYLQAILDRFTSSYATMFLALVFITALAWVYGVPQLSRDIKSMLNSEPSIAWKVIWTGITPTTLLVLLLMSLITYEPLRIQTYFTDYQLPSWTTAIGWLIAIFQIIPVFISAVLLYATSPKGAIRNKLIMLSKPSLLWGPALEVTELESEMTGNDGNSKRVYDRSTSVKVGKDIGGLDSIFSATVGNNVVVKMATSLQSNLRKEHQNPLSQKLKYSPSADLLAKRMDSNGGPITFQEDGETFMLVPKKKNKLPGIEKSTQTETISRFYVEPTRSPTFHLGDSEGENDSSIEVIITDHDMVLSPEEISSNMAMYDAMSN
ncbi:sodium- and chloride-dependent glycine transporter 1-like [Watersipora subatra]|uniref:sodium- and chloride-dependent glycine transporter 1-like n=1 Tax=Watersipora subatra TaxID=2589382 RepID=UPI00355B4B0D